MAVLVFLLASKTAIKIPTPMRIKTITTITTMIIVRRFFLAASSISLEGHFDARLKSKCPFKRGAEAPSFVLSLSFLEAPRVCGDRLRERFGDTLILLEGRSDLDLSEREGNPSARDSSLRIVLPSGNAVFVARLATREHDEARPVCQLALPLDSARGLILEGEQFLPVFLAKGHAHDHLRGEATFVIRMPTERVDFPISSLSRRTIPVDEDCVETGNHAAESGMHILESRDELTRLDRFEEQGEVTHVRGSRGCNGTT